MAISKPPGSRRSQFAADQIPGRIMALTLLLAFSGSGATGLAASQKTSDKSVENSNPHVAVYHKVWELITKQFYDPTYNDQNWNRWEHKYDKFLETDEDEQKAIDTMLASLGDRYTRYLSKAAFEEESIALKGSLFGIGVQIAFDAKSGKLIVVAPIDGSPAQKAGLRPNDEIESIDGEPTKGLSLAEASKRIKGPLDSVVTMKIVRNNERMEIPITRGEIIIKSVQMVKMLDKDIGYIRLSTFMSARAGNEVQEALVALTPARGIILDLRENPGGQVNNAIDICSLLIGGGVVVSTVDRNNKPVDTRVTGKIISNQPLVVLIDGGTASAAEITSGCLKDTGRAELVGPKRSFGKGLVQSVIRLEDGSGLHITIARYLTPNGIDINKKGIVPDYIVDLEKSDYENQAGPWWHYKGPNGAQPDPVGAKDLQLKKAMEVVEAKLRLEQNPLQLKLNTLNTTPVGPQLKLETPFINQIKLESSPLDLSH